MRTLLVFCAASLLAESAASVKWAAPPDWKTQGSTSTRAATYIVAPETECVVYFFGPGQGGTVEANIDRWKGQFRGPAAQVGKRTVHGLAVTTIDAAGEYSGAGGPMAKEKSIKPDFRLLGAVVEGPGGNLFVKFTGPAKVIAANQKKFEQFLASFEKE